MPSLDNEPNLEYLNDVRSEFRELLYIQISDRYGLRRGLQMASDIITLAHGAGGSVMQSLIKQYVLKHLGGANVEVPLTALDDAAVVDGIVFKSDSYTVKPIFFP